MKRILLYSLLSLAAFVSGCVANKSTAPAPLAPEGTFAGEFKVTTTNATTGAVDSLKATIQLQMEETTGYKVTGDTSTVHAGSYGSYAVNTSNSTITFGDKTFPLTGTPAKVHLSGVYDYLYDGTTLQMAAYGSDNTVSYYYNLKKTGN
jgi:hypothetical protein